MRALTNKKIAEACISQLISADKETFIGRLAFYLKDKMDLLGFFFDGPLLCDETIKDKISHYIINSLPCKEYFHGITDINIGFNYNYMQQYEVTYKATRFYSPDKQPWKGEPIADEQHPVGVITELNTTIQPEDINSINLTNKHNG